MANAAACLLALTLLAACPSVHAERSRLADEVDVVEAGDCEIETGFQRKTARGNASERAVELRLACGIGWGTELAVAFARTRSGDGRDRAIGVEAKTSLHERRPGGIGWTLVYGIAAERAGGRASWRHDEHFAAIEATYQPAAAWLLEAKLGTGRDRAARRDATLWSLAFEHAIHEGVELLAEVSGDDRGRPLSSVGLRHQAWPEHASWTLSYGVKATPVREHVLRLVVTFEF